MWYCVGVNKRPLLTNTRRMLDEVLLGLMVHIPAPCPYFSWRCVFLKTKFFASCIYLWVIYVHDLYKRLAGLKTSSPNPYLNDAKQSHSNYHIYFVTIATL